MLARRRFCHDTRAGAARSASAPEVYAPRAAAYADVDFDEL